MEVLASNQTPAPPHPPNNSKIKQSTPKNHIKISAKTKNE